MTMTDLIPWRRKNNMPVRREPGGDEWAGSFQREMNQLMNRFFEGVPADPFAWTQGFASGQFAPQVEISENDKAIKVSVELPGMDENDVDITLTSDSLAIKGEKKQEVEDRDRDFYRVERCYGAFHRVIPLGADVEKDKAEARFKKGVLKITLPKTAQAQQARKKIEIRTV